MMALLFTLIVDRPPHSGWDPGICKIWGIFRPPYANFATGLTDVDARRQGQANKTNTCKMKNVMHSTMDTAKSTTYFTFCFEK